MEVLLMRPVFGCLSCLHGIKQETCNMERCTCFSVGRPPFSRSGPGGPRARKQVVQFAQAVALTEQGGWSGGGQ